MAKQELYGFILSQFTNTENLVTNVLDSITEINPRKLPYDKFDASRPLVIFGDVDMSRYRPQPGEEIPHFDNVIVAGSFLCAKQTYITQFPNMVMGGMDCSFCGKKGDYINKNMRIPRGLLFIDFSYSIRGLRDLIGILPDNLQFVIVEPGLIKQSALEKDAEKLDAARDFIAAYPKVGVYDADKKISLRDELTRLVRCQMAEMQPVKTENTDKKLPIVSSEKIIAAKVDSLHLDTRDMLGMCRSDAAIAKFNLSDDELLRYIRRATSSGRGNIRKTEMMRSDGVGVKCVMFNQWPEIYRNIMEMIMLDMSAEKPEPVANPQSVNLPQAPVFTQTQMPQISVMKIEKYIPTNVWKSISKSCAPQQLENILYTIDEINVNPLDYITEQGPARIIKNGIHTNSRAITKKVGCCLTQSCDIGARGGRKRIVWTVGDSAHGPVIVGVGFVNDHTTGTKMAHKYSDMTAIASKKVMFDDDYLAGCHRVSDLITMQKNAARAR